MLMPFVRRDPGRAGLIAACIVVMPCCAAAAAADATAAAWAGVAPTTAQAWMEDVRAANEARAALGRETAAWTAERERLQAIVAAAAADGERLKQEAKVADAGTGQAKTDLAALGDAGDLDRLRARLDAAAADERARLAALSACLPPGVLAAPDAGSDDPFGAVMHALEGAETAAGTVSVDVVPGRLGNDQIAVKVLRVAGACAWWVALDGDQAGTVALDGRGGLTLTPAPDDDTRLAIRLALAAVEGRRPPELSILPLAPFPVAVVAPAAAPSAPPAVPGSAAAATGAAPAGGAP